MEKQLTEINTMPSDKMPVREKETLHNNLVDIELMVLCSTWDEDAYEALRCWGEDYASKSARGIIKKVSLRRKGNEPRFEIHFPEKPFQKTFNGLIFRSKIGIPLRLT